MANFIRVTHARKRYRCDNCRGPIEPGELYARHSSTPDDEYMSTGQWDNLRAHHPWGVCDTRLADRLNGK